MDKIDLNSINGYLNGISNSSIISDDISINNQPLVLKKYQCSSCLYSSDQVSKALNLNVRYVSLDIKFISNNQISNFNLEMCIDGTKVLQLLMLFSKKFNFNYQALKLCSLGLNHSLKVYNESNIFIDILNEAQEENRMLLVYSLNSLTELEIVNNIQKAIVDQNGFNFNSIKEVGSKDLNYYLQKYVEDEPVLAFTQCSNCKFNIIFPQISFNPYVSDIIININRMHQDGSGILFKNSTMFKYPLDFLQINKNAISHQDMDDESNQEPQIKSNFSSLNQDHLHQYQQSKMKYSDTINIPTVIQEAFDLSWFSNISNITNCNQVNNYKLVEIQNSQGYHHKIKSKYQLSNIGTWSLILENGKSYDIGISTTLIENNSYNGPIALRYQRLDTMLPDQKKIIHNHRETFNNNSIEVKSYFSERILYHKYCQECYLIYNKMHYIGNGSKQCEMFIPIHKHIKTFLKTSKQLSAKHASNQKEGQFNLTYQSFFNSMVSHNFICQVLNIYPSFLKRSSWRCSGERILNSTTYSIDNLQPTNCLETNTPVKFDRDAWILINEDLIFRQTPQYSLDHLKLRLYEFSKKYPIELDYLLYLFIQVQKGRCYYSGSAFLLEDIRFMPSLERLNNSLTHTHSNCRFIIRILNSIDNNRGLYDDHQDWSISKFKYARGIYLSYKNGAGCSRPWGDYKMNCNITNHN